jgi:hypothetical protein
MLQRLRSGMLETHPKHELNLGVAAKRHSAAVFLFHAPGAPREERFFIPALVRRLPRITFPSPSHFPDSFLEIAHASAAFVAAGFSGRTGFLTLTR